MVGDLANKLLVLRHSNVHACLGVQHPSRVPQEVLGNCDCLVVFALQDERDRRPIAQAMNLTREQAVHLPMLEPGHAVCFLPRLQFKRPFLLELPRRGWTKTRR